MPRRFSTLYRKNKNPVEISLILGLEEECRVLVKNRGGFIRRVFAGNAFGFRSEFVSSLMAPKLKPSQTFEIISKLQVKSQK